MGIQASNLVDSVFDQLQSRIIEGGFEADQKLVISNLAEEFGISAIPVREALAKLSAIGLVSFIPNQGYRVSAGLTKKEFIDLFETRLMLDLAAVPGLMKNITDDDVEALKKLNTKMAKSYKTQRYSQFQSFMSLNSEFHRQLIAIANNNFLEKLYDDLYIEMFISRHIMNANIEFAELIHGHDEILAALEQRDTKGLREALIDHLTQGINIIFGYTEKIELNPPA